MELVPTVDLRARDAVSLDALDRACRDHGFFLLAGHGHDALIERVWAETRRFFAAPRASLEAIRRTEERPLGFYDRELTKRRRDAKRVFDFMEPDGAIGRKRNRWPEGLDGFRETMAEFFAAMSTLSAGTLELVHAALGLPPEVAKRHAGSALTSTVRLNHYPLGDPLAEDERAGLPELGETALGHHTDPGVITLLLQDDAGGLQTHSYEEGWIDVPPRDGTIVVNVADSLQVWSNDRYRAAVHRVVPMTARERYSIPYFFNPALDAVIEPIPELADAGPRYRPFTWREFIQARIDDNYRDLGTDDTQAAQFRI